jgi:hypothetical protein
MAANIKLADALSFVRTICRQAMSRASELIGGRFAPWYDLSRSTVEEGEHKGRGSKSEGLANMFHVKHIRQIFAYLAKR